MDRATNSTAPADRLFCAVELSKNSWLLGIQFPDRQKASIYPLKGGDSEGLMARLIVQGNREETRPAIAVKRDRSNWVCDHGTRSLLSSVQ
jgi:hypothetical protein